MSNKVVPFPRSQALEALDPLSMDASDEQLWHALKNDLESVQKQLLAVNTTIKELESEISHRKKIAGIFE